MVRNIKYNMQKIKQLHYYHCSASAVDQSPERLRSQTATCGVCGTAALGLKSSPCYEYQQVKNTIKQTNKNPKTETSSSSKDQDLSVSSTAAWGRMNSCGEGSWSLLHHSLSYPVSQRALSGQVVQGKHANSSKEEKLALHLRPISRDLASSFPSHYI